MNLAVAYLEGLSRTAPMAMAGTALILATRGRTKMRTTLESGAWVEHVPIQDVKGRHIRDYARAGKGRISRDAVDDEGNVDVRTIVEQTDLGERQEARHDALWAIVISAWSYEFPVPVFDRGAGETSGAEVLEEIPADDYREIDKLVEPFEKKLTAKPNPKAQAAATTSSSNGSSRAKAGSSRRA
jgi:hypothetical protein